MRLEYAAPKEVREVIATLGRTEDARLSPDGTRLAVAGFLKNRIAIFKIEIQAKMPGKTVILSAVSVLASPDLKAPHGLDFIDNETLVVANRNGGVYLYRLPQTCGSVTFQEFAVSPLACIKSDLLSAPGSVAVFSADTGCSEILLCNNSGNSVSRHQFDASAHPSVKGHKLLLKKWLDIPDGISVSANRHWLALSNHKLHTVMLYRNPSDLQPEIDPQGLLCGAQYPHGLRFSKDDRFILVADAGAPFVYIYARQNEGWSGLHYPRHTLRVMDDAEFQRGRYNPMEGGPKGLDLDNANGILITTCARQPLAFFDVEHFLASSRTTACSGVPCSSADAADIQYELEHQQRHADAARRSAKTNSAETELKAVLASRSWRITAPLRWALSAVKGSK